MKTISVILSLLQVWLVVTMPTCHLEGQLVQVAHNLLQNLVQSLTFQCNIWDSASSGSVSICTELNSFLFLTG